jgi:hypothetical protein
MEGRDDDEERMQHASVFDGFTGRAYAGGLKGIRPEELRGGEP